MPIIARTALQPLLQSLGRLDVGNAALYGRASDMVIVRHGSPSAQQPKGIEVPADFRSQRNQRACWKRLRSLNCQLENADWRGPTALTFDGEWKPDAAKPDATG
jgi:hypothetical protein